MKFPKLSAAAIALLIHSNFYEQDACCTPMKGRQIIIARALVRHGLLAVCDCTEGRNCFTLTTEGAAWHAQQDEAQAETTRYAEAYNVVTKLIHEGDTSSPAYWDAVRSRDVVREIAADHIGDALGLSLAKARETAIYCADHQGRTVIDAARALGYIR